MQSFGLLKWVLPPLQWHPHLRCCLTEDAVLSYVSLYITVSCRSRRLCFPQESSDSDVTTAVLHWWTPPGASSGSWCAKRNMSNPYTMRHMITLVNPVPDNHEPAGRWLRDSSNFAVMKNAQNSPAGIQHLYASAERRIKNINLICSMICHKRVLE